ncbi:hypothetical protein AC1031_019300 [Aphanomyces cochlioides]|nr:hypothetical protein AC1031_019300 [Aphanomyces cochlioides]
MMQDQDALGDVVVVCKEKSFRFKVTQDIDLLKEIELHKPWSASHGSVQATWNVIASSLSDHFGEKVNAIACQRRFELLLEAFKKDEMKPLRASGTVEEYNERKQLLTALKEMIDDFELEKEESNVRVAEEAAKKKAIAIQMMERAMETIAQRDVDDGHDKKQSKPSKCQKLEEDNECLRDLVEIQLAANETEKERLQILSRQLDLQERTLAMQEERLRLDAAQKEIEILERKQELELNRLERKQAIESQSAVVQLINYLMQKTNN